MKYNVVIIGGGLAGLTCGYLLKNTGKSVLIIEKEQLNEKEKLCGGLLTEKSFKLFNDIYGSNNDVNFKAFEDFKVINGDTIVNFHKKMYSVDRKVLDDYALLKYIDTDGKILQGIKDYEVDLENNTIVVGDEIYTYDYLIGADGVFSKLRSIVTGTTQRKNFAFEVKTKPSDNLEIFFYNNFKGYGWIIPNNISSMVGVGDVSQNVKIEDVLDNHLNVTGIAKKDVRGAFLPTGDDMFLQKNNVFFIGDSSGMISPILGEGIYYAFLTAKLLAQNLGTDYNKACKKHIKIINKELVYKKYIYKDKLRDKIFRHSNNILVKAALNHFMKKHL